MIFNGCQLSPEEMGSVFSKALKLAEKQLKYLKNAKITKLTVMLNHNNFLRVPSSVLLSMYLAQMKSVVMEINISPKNCQFHAA